MSPAASTSARGRLRVGDVRLHGPCRRSRPRPPRPRPGRCGSRRRPWLRRGPSSTAIGAADAARGARDERRLAVQRAEPAHARQGLPRLLEAREVVDRDRAHAPVDPLDEAGEHVAGPDLDERRDAVVDELPGGLREAHRRRELVDEQRAEPRGRLDARRHGRHERRDRVVEADPLDRRLEPVGRTRDERAVERARDLQLDRSSSAEALGLGAAAPPPRRSRRRSRSGRGSCSSPARRRRSCGRASRPPRPRDRGSRPSSRGACGRPRPSRDRARARARSPRRFRSRRRRRAPRTRRPSGRRRRRARAPRREARRGSRGTSRRAPAAAPRSRRGPRAASRSRAAARSSPEASLPSR